MVQHHLCTLDVVAETPSPQTESPLTFARFDCDKLPDLMGAAVVVGIISQDRHHLTVSRRELPVSPSQSFSLPVEARRGTDAETSGPAKG